MKRLDENITSYHTMIFRRWANKLHEILYTKQFNYLSLEDHVETYRIWEKLWNIFSRIFYYAGNELK